MSELKYDFSDAGQAPRVLWRVVAPPGSIPSVWEATPPEAVVTGEVAELPALRNPAS